MKYKKGAPVLPGYHHGIGLFCFWSWFLPVLCFANLMVIQPLKKKIRFSGTYAEHEDICQHQKVRPGCDINPVQVPLFSDSTSFLEVNRYMPFGMVISNRAPLPGSPHS
jgi:hypothetical protein